MRRPGSRIDSRFTTVIAAAAVVGLLGGGVGFAAATINSADIVDNSVKSRDVKDNSIKLRDIGKRAQSKLQGQQGPAGPAGPAGNATVVEVKDLTGDWKARATDVAGLKMTGDGIQFGPFADGGACAVDGQDYARLDYSGMNGKTLNDLKSLVYHARYTADNDTSGVGAPTVRVFFSGAENPNGNRLTFSPNTQFNNPLYYDIEQGQFHEWVVTSGTVRLNDDAGNDPSGEDPWSSYLATYGTRTIENINVLNGCQNGTNLSSLIRRFEINGVTYQFGATG